MLQYEKNTRKVAHKVWQIHNQNSHPFGYDGPLCVAKLLFTS